MEAPTKAWIGSDRQAMGVDLRVLDERRTQRQKFLRAYAHVVGLVVRRDAGRLAYAAGVAGTSNPDESVTPKSSTSAKRKPSLDLTAVELDPGQTSDDTDAAWGEGQPSTDDVRRYLDEKPPHHGD